ncbi:MAG: flagellar biosynthetic protein FliO [Candidatus Caenarcaniphilales bacterium]|nr:flagellar biosynthetic protein FliO [Candidatus Caenarcaniphilales bacterium]
MEDEILKKFVLCLVPLLFLWGLSVWLLKVKSGGFSFKNNVYLQRLDSIILSQANSIHLVKVSESEILLIGVSSNQTNLLASYDKDKLQPIDVKNNAKAFDREELLTQVQKLFKQERKH